MTIDFTNPAHVTLLCLGVFVYTLLVMWGGDNMKADSGLFPGILAAGPLLASLTGMVVGFSLCLIKCLEK